MFKGLPRRLHRPLILALLILTSAAGVVSAENSAIIYSTDFSSNPNWVTNNPYTNHWDEEKGTFHYFLRDSTNTFVYKRIPYTGGSFRLEYDLFPARTDFQSSFRLGLGTRDMSINQGSTIFSEFENGPYGNLMWIRVIDQSNQRREASSYSQSYGGPSVRFTDGIPYHVIISYDRDLKTTSIAISFLGNGSTLWGYTLSSVANLGHMDRIYLSTIGDFENPSAVAEGDIDNLIMSAILPSTGPGTPSATSPTTMGTGGQTLTAPATVPATSAVPVTTPTSTPVPSLLAIAALALGALLLPLSRK